MPVFLFETGYEREHGISQARLRKSIYEAALSCPAGQLFGKSGELFLFSLPRLHSIQLRGQSFLSLPEFR